MNKTSPLNEYIERNKRLLLAAAEKFNASEVSVCFNLQGKATLHRVQFFLNAGVYSYKIDSKKRTKDEDIFTNQLKNAELIILDHSS